MLLVEVPHDLITLAVSTISTLKEELTEVISGDNPFQTNMANLESSASPKCSNMNTDDDKDMKSIRLDISFLSPSHTGIQTTELMDYLVHKAKLYMTDWHYKHFWKEYIFLDRCVWKRFGWTSSYIFGKTSSYIFWMNVYGKYLDRLLVCIFFDRCAWITI